MSDLRAAFSDLAVELEKHSNDHIHDDDPADRLGAAVEGVCADRINAILKHAPDLAALEAQFREKAMEHFCHCEAPYFGAQIVGRHHCERCGKCVDRSVLALHAEIVEKRKGGQ